MPVEMDAAPDEVAAALLDISWDPPGHIGVDEVTARQAQSLDEIRLVVDD